MFEIRSVNRRSTKCWPRLADARVFVIFKHLNFGGSDCTSHTVRTVNMLRRDRRRAAASETHSGRPLGVPPRCCSASLVCSPRLTSKTHNMSRVGRNWPNLGRASVPTETNGRATSGGFGQSSGARRDRPGELSGSWRATRRQLSGKRRASEIIGRSGPPASGAEERMDAARAPSMITKNSSPGSPGRSKAQSGSRVLFSSSACVCAQEGQVSASGSAFCVRVVNPH